MIYLKDLIHDGPNLALRLGNQLICIYLLSLDLTRPYALGLNPGRRKGMCGAQQLSIVETMVQAFYKMRGQGVYIGLRAI